MQLYSEEKDWGKLVEVVLKLGAGVDDKKQKAKYIHTAAGVAARQLGDLDAAIKYLNQVAELDPSNTKVLDELIEFHEQKGDWEALMGYLKKAIKRLESKGDKDGVVAMLDRIAVLYDDKLGKTDKAITVYEQAQQLDPDNAERLDTLAKLYNANPTTYLLKALDTQMTLLHRNPADASTFRTLRKLYTGAKEADPAWCVCQALYVMNVSEPDEERFYRRMRADGPAEPGGQLDEEEWAVALTHPSLDPVVTQIFQLIEPAIMAKNAQSLVSLGYQEAYALDLSMHPYPMSQTIHDAAGLLGMELPMTFQNPNDPGGLSFLHAQPPCIVLGAAALQTELPPQPSAFIAAQHLSYYRSGLYVRHLVPSGTGLRGWLFAAIKLIHDQFPVSAELEGMVNEYLEGVRAVAQGPAREQLASAVSKLLQSGAIDLKKWVAGVDLTADRAGFLLCNDLEIATEMVKASDESSNSLSHRDRIRELTMFSVDRTYLALRRKLGVNIDA